MEEILFNEISTLPVKACYLYGAHKIAKRGLEILDRAGLLNRIDKIIVTSLDNNPDSIMGIKVHSIFDIDDLSEKIVVIATPEMYHKEICDRIGEAGVKNYIRITGEILKDGFRNLLFKAFEEMSGNRLMLVPDPYDKYYMRLYDKDIDDENFYLKLNPVKNAGLPVREEDNDVIKSLHIQEYCSNTIGKYLPLSEMKSSARNDFCAKDYFDIYIITSHRDKMIEQVSAEDYLIPIQAGANNTTEKRYEIRDNYGDNISEKNNTLAEMTAIYWIWKNSKEKMYKGVCHYRRRFILSSVSLQKMIDHNIDALLAVPRVVFPSVRNTFASLTEDSDCDKLLEIIKSKYPSWYEKAAAFYNGNLFYPCNMFIAKSQVFDDCCQFVFSILLAFDDYYRSIGRSCDNKFSAYWAETLTSLYFVINQDKYKIVIRDFRLLN